MITAESPPLQTQAPKWTKKQESILIVAATIFSDRGFANTDVQVIADEAGVGKGTVYRNFSTKDDLFCSTVDREIHLMTQYIDEAFQSEADALDGLHAVIRAYLKYFDELPSLWNSSFWNARFLKTAKNPPTFNIENKSGLTGKVLFRI